MSNQNNRRQGGNGNNRGNGALLLNIDITLKSDLRPSILLLFPFHNSIDGVRKPFGLDELKPSDDFVVDPFGVLQKLLPKIRQGVCCNRERGI
jgi:hypothetical protein